MGEERYVVETAPRCFRGVLCRRRYLSLVAKTQLQKQLMR
jgi:hypothetical protein